MTAMLFLWIFLILIVCALATSFFVLQQRATQLKKRQEILKTALWERRNLIPLVLEVVKRHGITLPHRPRLIAMRRQLMSNALLFQEEMDIEAKLSAELNNLFRSLLDEEAVSLDALYLSAKREFLECNEKIRIAVNDFDFALEQLRSCFRFPVFKMFEPLFKISQNKIIKPF